LEGKPLKAGGWQIEGEDKPISYSREFGVDEKFLTYQSPGKENK